MGYQRSTDPTQAARDAAPIRYDGEEDGAKEDARAEAKRVEEHERRIDRALVVARSLAADPRSHVGKRCHIAIVLGWENGKPDCTSGEVAIHGDLGSVEWIVPAPASLGTVMRVEGRPPFVSWRGVLDGVTVRVYANLPEPQPAEAA